MPRGHCRRDSVLLVRRSRDGDRVRGAEGFRIAHGRLVFGRHLWLQDDRVAVVGQREHVGTPDRTVAEATADVGVDLDLHPRSETWTTSSTTCVRNVRNVPV